MDGWIKINRSLLDWEWYTDDHMVRLFLHLLLKANIEDKRWRGIVVKRGQLITGRKQLSEEIGISERSIRTCLSRLNETGEITIKTTNQYSIVTICKYDSYQLAENQNDQQTTNKRPANDQQTTTTKELKNIYNISQQANACACEEVGIGANDKFFVELQQDQVMMEKTCMNLHIMPTTYTEQLEAFKKEIEIKQTVHRDAADYRRHFYDWLRIQVQKKQKGVNNGFERSNHDGYRTPEEQDRITMQINEQIEREARAQKGPLPF